MEASTPSTTPAIPVLHHKLRLWKYISLGATILLIALVVGFILWSRPAPAESAALQQAYQTKEVQIADKDSYLALTRPDASLGFVFYPGARVTPEAYLGKLAPVVRAAPINIYIVRMPFSLALLKTNAADEIMAANSSVTKWYVGGHSLGGVVACRYADTNANKLVGLVLEASYCDQDISQSKLAVLQIYAENDKLVAEARLKNWEKNLPADTEKVLITGANHAQFGNYGQQAGDGVSTVADEEVGRQLQDILGGFFNAAAIQCADCVQTGE